MKISLRRLPMLIAALVSVLPATISMAAELPEIVRLMERQNYAGAEPMLRTILAREDDADAEYLLGFLLIETYRYDEAEQHLRKAVDARPQEDHWLMVLAKAQLEQGKNRAAGQVLQRAIALDPNPDYLHAHAMTALNTGDLAAAEASLRACLERNAEHADALFRLGGLLMDQNHNEEGIKYLERARTVNPQNVDTLYRLGSAYRHTGKLDEAEQLLTAVVSRVPGHVGALHNLSRVLIESGQEEAARKVMQKFQEMSKLRDEIDFNALAVRKNPENIEGRLLLASLYMRAGRVQDALTDLHEARVLAPRDARIYRSLAAAYRGLGDDNNALRAERFADSIGGKASQ